MRKTPNKWAIGRPKMKPKNLAPRLETDNLGSQKSQNALKTADATVRQKKKKKSRNKNKIVRMFGLVGAALFRRAPKLGPSPSLSVRVRGRSGLNAARAAILLNAKSH